MALLYSSGVIIFVVGEQIVHGDLMQTVVVNHALGTVSEKQARVVSKPSLLCFLSKVYSRYRVGGDSRVGFIFQKVKKMVHFGNFKLSINQCYQTGPIFVGQKLI